MTHRWVRWPAAAALAILAVVGPVDLGAQRNQPIYPAYDGFIRNDDGSYTIAFGYFSHNAEIVEIAPGPGNSFAPAPADRQQPIRFHPGHHRFQCVMVVPPDFKGDLRWALTYAGTTTGTSERMLQSNWNLVEGAAQLRQIEFAKVPRGVCLNQPPEVRVLGLPARPGRDGALPRLEATMDEPLNLFGSVQDEGLPRTGVLTAGWKALSGPGTARFQNPSAARTRATFSAPGTYTLELTATDTELTRSYRLDVVVAR